MTGSTGIGITPGLCSVTMRSLHPDQVIALAASNGLGAIEWGGDVHLPPGDERQAEHLARRSTDAGVDVASYGSYLFAGQSDSGEVSRVLDTAVAVRAPNVRVWCPLGLGPTSEGRERAAVVDALQTIVSSAIERRLTVSLEYHQGTLTETAASAGALLEAVGSSALFTYWQPVPGRDHRAELAAIADDVSHLHVFRWAEDGTRLALSDGADLWPEAFASLGSGRWARTRVAFLEFVRDDDPDQLAADAATLRAWL